MIDISTEQLLTLSEAAALLPGKPSIATLWRWRTKGARGRRLESITLGAKVYTSVEALARFAQQQGGADTAATRSPARREKEIRRAEVELEKAGA
jgi:Protein of unknown function (DUF1580)